MIPSQYEIEATIRLHRQDLVREAERDRLFGARWVPPAPLRRMLASAGRRLVVLGSRLEARWTDSSAAGWQARHATKS